MDSRQPGVTRDNRLSDEGLLRLEQQLKEGRKMSTMVLKQWIVRYGDPARDIIRRYNCYSDELDH
jgi:hypothetical protein